VTKRCDKAKEISTVPIKYLARREDGRSLNFYVRMVAPKAIQHLLPESDRVYRESTGTADLRRANVIGAEMVARKLKEWRALEDQLSDRQSSPAILSQSLIDQISAARLHSWVFSDDAERWSDEGLDDEELQAVEAFSKTTDAQMRSILSQGKGSREWRAVVETVLEWCEVQAYSVSVNDPMFPQLVRAFARVEQRAQQLIAARNRGDEVEVPLPAPTAVGRRLSAIIEPFVAYKTPTVKGPKPVSMAVSIWEKFIEFKGDALFDDVTSDDVYNFIDARLNASAKPWSQGYVDGHVKRCLREMFSFARTKKYMTVPNPVTELEITPKISLDEQAKRQKPRYPFARAQLDRLFTSEWYNIDTKALRGKCRYDLGVRYFAPLIGLFHGSRVREYLQLMTSDIIVEGEVDCFKFQLELEEMESEGNLSDGEERQQELPQRSVKKPTVLRTIPIHPRLIELGFLDYVKERRVELGGVGPLFASSVPNPGGMSPMWGRAYEQSFLRFVRDNLGFGSGYGSHSFRHLFEDRLRSAQAVAKTWPAGLANFLSGRLLPRDADRLIFRSTGSEQGYGNGYGPKDILPYLAQVDFSDITLPAKFSDWCKS
jgi:integrase